MRIFHAILPGSLPRATIKRRGNLLSPSSMQAFRAKQTCPIFLFSLPHWLAEGILTLCFLAVGRTNQHERPHSLFFTDSLSYILSNPLSTMRRPHPIYGLGVWEIILSLFIFPSKPTDPQRNKLDIFNSCFEYSVLILALSFTTDFLFPRLTAKGFLLSQAVNKTSKLKTINIFDS